jgi:hypothetical protein
MVARANQLYEQASKQACDTFDRYLSSEPDLVALATAYLLLADYAPSQPGSYVKSWDIVKKVCAFSFKFIVIIFVCYLFIHLFACLLVCLPYILLL